MIAISRVFWLYLTIIKKYTIMENQKTSEINHMHLAFERGRGTIINSLAPTIDEPMAVFYFKSGWQYGYPMYHVIIEYGDTEQTEYHHISEESLCKRFDVTPEMLNDKIDIKVTKEDLREFPNDQDLGRSVRKQFII